VPAGLMEDEEFMRMAMAKAREGVELGELPFGACIVKDGTVLGCEHNTILSGGDVTAHAEMNAIRRACDALKTLDLSRCVAYCTCEPCPMCLGLRWRIFKVVYGRYDLDCPASGWTLRKAPEIDVRWRTGNC